MWHKTPGATRPPCDVPFRSLISGLTDAHERIGKRLSIMMTVTVTFLALGLLIRIVKKEQMNERGALALAFAAALATYMLFHFSLGGVFGYKWLDRHFSQVNPIIDWALFYQKNLRWFWIFCLVLSGVIFAIGTGAGTHYLIFK